MALLNPNPANTIDCSDINGLSTLKSLVFQNSGVAVIQGANELFSLALNNFFMPVTQYQYSEYILPAGGSVMLDPGNISNANGEVTGIVLVVEYPNKNIGGTILLESEKYIQYSIHNGDSLNIGKIMIQTGSGKSGSGWNLIGSPGGLLLTNPATLFDVTIKVLLIS